MTILPIVAVCAVVLVVAYFTYGRLVAHWLGLDASRPTPAVEMEDGNDYVPAPAPVVLGGHFTAIAAAGPVVGPILAGLAFGWLPALLWIILGAIFIGGVHDAGSLFASIRHRARSITEVVRQHMSRPAYVTFLLFVWISLVYVIIAFADVTAGTFANFQIERITRGGQTEEIALNGGAVVIGATAYLVLSVLLGLALRFTKTPWWAGLLACVVILTLCIWQAPQMAAWLDARGLSFMDTQGKDRGLLTKYWDQALLVYCFIASITPMWLLLQPRGVVGATFLYVALFFGVAGALAGGWSSGGELAVRWPAFKGFTAANGMWLFPFLFITIACGACSGFHSIVSSGTTSKQVRNERDVRPIGYGAMLLESMVAVFALACVMILAPDSTAGSPHMIYAVGIGRFAAQLNVPLMMAVSFGLLAFSSFVFDTLDVCTRLGRYVLQEMTGLKGLSGGATATLITLAGPSLYLWYSPAGSFQTFWTIFGTSNQLLAALTLVGVSVWLWRTGRNVWFALAPAAFMVCTTGTALVLNFLKFWNDYDVKPQGMLITNMSIAAVLFMLGALVVFEAVRVWRMARRDPVRVAVPVEA
jgi:carbon starvation protein